MIERARRRTPGRHRRGTMVPDGHGKPCAEGHRGENGCARGPGNLALFGAIRGIIEANIEGIDGRRERGQAGQAAGGRTRQDVGQGRHGGAGIGRDAGGEDGHIARHDSFGRLRQGARGAQEDPDHNNIFHCGRV